MGLVHPVSCQVVQNFVHGPLVIGRSSMQGFRQTMEDSLTIATKLDNHPGCSFFAIYDGHGGNEASEFAEREIVKRINSLKHLNDDGIRQVIHEADQEFLHNSNKRRKHGTCAIMAVIKQVHDSFEIICANVGDSRMVLGTIPSSLHERVPFQVLSRDHKPDLRMEKERIERAGGFVDSGRVDGTLAVSRALGDWVFKNNTNLEPHQQKVISVPEFFHTSAGKNNFLLLACDGIFEALSNSDIASIIGRGLCQTKSEDMSAVLITLLSASLEAGSRDNMTAILITFNRTSQNSSEKTIIQPSLADKFDELSSSQKNDFFRAYVAFASSEGFESEARRYLQKHYGYDGRSSSPHKPRSKRKKNSPGQFGLLLLASLGVIIGSYVYSQL